MPGAARPAPGGRGRPSLLALAAAGDPVAWEAVLARCSGVLGAVLEALALDTGVAAEVADATWLRLAVTPGRVVDEDLAVQVAAYALEEASRLFPEGAAPGGPGRPRPTPAGGAAGPPETARAGGADARAAVLARLPERSRLLVRLLEARPTLPRGDVSRILRLADASRWARRPGREEGGVPPAPAARFEAAEV